MLRFEGANSLLQGFLECAADGHDFADGFHLRAESAIRAGKLFKLPLGNFHDDVVDGGFEAGRGFLVMSLGISSRDMPTARRAAILAIGKPVALLASAELRETRGIHFDDGHAAVFGIDGELDVGAAGFHADFADDGRGGIAHALVFLVGECLRGSHGDGIAGVNAHGIEIFDGADDHEVVAVVAHDFEFVFFPAEDGFFDEGFVDGAHVQGVGDGFAKFFLVVGDGAAGAAESEGRTDNERKAELIAEAHGILRVIDERGSGNFEADFAAGILEPEAVFGNFDGAERGADHFDFVLFENAAFGEFDGKIESGLAADGGKQRVGFFAYDNLLEIFLGERLDVGAVGQFRIGHDRGGIGIDENDFVALGAESFAGLRAGIVEFASLADDDRAGADDQDFLDVSAFRHRESDYLRKLPSSGLRSAEQLSRFR